MSEEAGTDAVANVSAATAYGSRPPVLTRRIMLVGALVVLVFVALAGFAGYQVGRSGDVPDEGGADVGFARDMQTHHNQAVHMALTIRDKTSDPTLRAVAYDIATSQSQQAGQLYGWLAHWGLPATSSDRPMAWMSAGQHLPEDAPAGSSAASSPPTVGGAGATGSQDGMPAMSGMPEKPASGQSGEMSMGMATTEQLKSLQRATGLQAERQFLTLMIAHHQGGVQMARAALRLATKPEVLTLARAIDTAQTAEIAQLQQLLEARR